MDKNNGTFSINEIPKQNVITEFVECGDFGYFVSTSENFIPVYAPEALYPSIDHALKKNN